MRYEIMLAKLKMSTTKRNLLVDLLIVSGFLLTMQRHLTGLTLHELLGVALGVGFLTHVLLHWRWVYETTRRLFSKAKAQARINYVLNLGLLTAFTLIIFSGFMISEEVLPMIGLEGVRGGSWKWLHTASADAVVWLVALHIALHWKWILNAGKKYLFGWLPQRRKTAVISPETAVVNSSEVTI
jgi:hypothetical protein